MFIELHAQSAFSFLEGAEHPEVFAAEAARLDMPAVALIDRDGVYGAARLARAAAHAGVKPIVGSEITLVDGARLPLLVEDREGYQNLCRLITRMKLGAAKGAAATALDDLEPYAAGLVCLTGGARGPLALRLAAGDGAGARQVLARLVAIFGRSNCFVEVQRHFVREQEEILQGLVTLARAARLPLVASNQPLFARPEGRPLADVFTGIRAKTGLDRAGRRLLTNGERWLKGGGEMMQLFRDLPDALANTGEVALRLAFTLKDLGYRFPEFPLPPGQTPLGHLRELTERGVRARYGAGPLAARARRQIVHELDLIGRLDLAGYFLIVWDIVEYCRTHDILVQGRGSAANSAVCYSLGITAVDPVGMGLLFERFLSEHRSDVPGQKQWPDIDLDLPSGDQREKVIQHVYQRYGAAGAAMTANVITYRARSASREIGKVLGLPQEELDRISKLLPQFEFITDYDSLQHRAREAGLATGDRRVGLYLQLCQQIAGLPRHLGQHSGGMVIARGRLDEIVPLEPASMPGRVVVQWDKDDCADLGIIKIDLLGLGMMAVLEQAIPLVHAHEGVQLDLAQVPPDDPGVYRLLKAADTIGVFQVESRAQMATLPRMRPDHFYDIVVEVAIIRPGPIVGQMVNPYLERRAGRQEPSVPHPSLWPVLERTLGVPLFQQQLMRIAMTAAMFNCWPTGFYSHARVVNGGQGRGVRVKAIDVKRSDWLCALERAGPEEELRVRLGLRYARGLREAVGKKIVEERGRAPFASIADLAARPGLRRDELAALAEIGALASVPMRPGGPLPTRRAALWQAEAASRRGPGLFARIEPREDLMSDPSANMVAGGTGLAPQKPLAPEKQRAGALLAHVNAHPREHALKALRTFGEEVRGEQL